MPEELNDKLELKVTELLILFERFGRSALGLFLLEIGWTFLLLMASKLASEGGREVSLLGTWKAGAIVIAVFWAFYSRLYAYLTTPLIFLLRPLWDFGFMVAIGFAALLDVSRDRRITPKREAQIDEVLQKEKANALARGTGTREEREANYEAWVEKFEKTHGKGVRRSIAGEKVSLQPGRFMNAVGKSGQRLLSPLHKGIRIGIAPLNDFARSNSFAGLRSPAEQFGSDVADLFSKLRDVEEVKYVRFFALPTHFPVRTHRDAAFALRLFKLDALVWGFLSSDERHTRAHILTPSDLDPGENLSSKAKLTELDIFPFSPVPYFGVLQSRARSDTGRHIILLAAVLRALSSQDRNGDAARGEKTGPWRQIWRNLVRNIGGIILYSEVEEKILDYLAREVLPATSPASREAGVIPDSAGMAAMLVSQYAGKCLQDASASSLSSRWRHGKEPFARKLQNALEKCVEITPDDPATHLRLGALACLLDEKDRALAAFRRGGELLVASGEHRAVPFGIRSDLLLRDLEKDLERIPAYYDPEIMIVQFAAYAAATISSGDGAKIQRMLDKAGEHRAAVIGIEVMTTPATRVALTVTRQLLGEPQASSGHEVVTAA